MKHILLSLITLISLFNLGFSQNVGISASGALPDSSAGLDVNFLNKGLLIPRVSLTSTTDVVTIVAPANSLLAYNTNAGMTGGSVGYWYWDGGKWVNLLSGSTSATAWSLLGNAGTINGTNFIGTTDNIPLNIRVNNQKAGRIDNTLANSFWGYQAGNANTTGSNNIANGYQALFSNTTGANNTANGYQALLSNTTGASNVASGYQSLHNNTAANSNTANGAYTLYSNTTGSNNIANGYQALYTNTTGSNNVANGVQALFSNTTGSNNTTSGTYTLYSNTTGANNVANGVQALQTNTIGNNNTANGYQALFLNTTGGNNTASGYGALYSNTTGGNNTAVGYLALSTNIIGNSNTATGYQALYVSTGDKNTATGYGALITNTIGTSNTAIGYGADVSANNLTNATAIGYSAIAGASNSLVLGATGANQVNVGVGTTTPNNYLETAGSFGTAVTTITTNITLSVIHYTVIITGGTPIVTLPAAAAGNNRRSYRIINQTASPVTISSYISFAGAGATTILANSKIEVQSNGTSWYRVD